jgi:NAD(P)-dependent dehydrogenase (short-subunit alcohol dehydrogenase family)
MDLGLKNKAVLVVGATGGIGGAVARVFAREGSMVALAGRDGEILERLTGEISSEYGGRTVSSICDVTDSGQVEACVRHALNSFGRIDCAVMSAGNARRGGLDEVEEADFESTWQVKLMGSVRLVRAVLPVMREGGGSIVLIVGLNGRRPSPGAVVGGSVNAGLTNFAQAMALAAARDGVTINVVDPHFTATARWERQLDRIQQQHGISREEATAKALERVPLGRAIQPEEVADLVAFLCSERARAITGAAVPIDGGSALGPH